MTIHFEELWNKSEDISSKIHKDTNIQDLLKIISNLTEDYKKLHLLEISPDVNAVLGERPEEIKSDMKKRYMGEIVFILTAISAKENINVYSSLQEEIKLRSGN